MKRSPTFLLLALGLLAMAPPAAAQAFEGRVIDYETEEPLEGADVFLLNEEDVRVALTFTDSLGLFRLAAPGPGSWRIGAELLGHAGSRSELVDLDEDETKQIMVRMTIDPVQLDEPLIVVVPRGYGSPDLEEFWRRVERGEQSGFGDYLYGAALERGALYASDVLRSVPGVRVTSGRIGDGQLVLMRGGCIPAIFIDGTMVNRARRGDSLDMWVNLLDIEGIEVYKGAEQPGGRYFDHRGCGLVLIWTKRGIPTADGEFHWRRLAIGIALLLGVLLLR